MDFNELFNKMREYKVGFVSLRNYESSQGEISDVLITIGFNYPKMKEKDIKILTSGVDFVSSTKWTTSDWALALSEKLKSLVSPDANRSAGQTSAYVNLLENGTLKYHVENQSLKIMGVVVRKSVKVEGTYPAVKSSAKTLAKKEIEKSLHTSTIRYYTIDFSKVTSINFNGNTFELGF